MEDNRVEKDSEKAYTCVKCKRVIPKDDHLIIHKEAYNISAAFAPF